MKTYVHTELTRLVARSVFSLSDDQMKSLMFASIEPDLIEKNGLKHKKSLASINWFLEHSVYAKRWAEYCVHVARQNKDNWIRPLGWAFHFIGDWATPYHSLHSRVYEMDEEIRVGEQLRPEIGMITALFLGVNNILQKHNEFEGECDQRLKQTRKRVYAEYKKYISFTKKDGFNGLMEQLRDYANSIDRTWIYHCEKKEFVRYMLNIARVMTFAAYSI